jgi:hypothetical protein
MSVRVGFDCLQAHASSSGKRFKGRLAVQKEAPQKALIAVRFVRFSRCFVRIVAFIGRIEPLSGNLICCTPRSRTLDSAPPGAIDLLPRAYGPLPCRLQDPELRCAALYVACCCTKDRLPRCSLGCLLPRHNERKDVRPCIAGSGPASAEGGESSKRTPHETPTSGIHSRSTGRPERQMHYDEVFHACQP